VVARDPTSQAWGAQSIPSYSGWEEPENKIKNKYGCRSFLLFFDIAAGFRPSFFVGRNSFASHHRRPVFINHDIVTLSVTGYFQEDKILRWNPHKSRS